MANSLLPNKNTNRINHLIPRTVGCSTYIPSNLCSLHTFKIKNRITTNDLYNTNLLNNK